MLMQPLLILLGPVVTCLGKPLHLVIWLAPLVGKMNQLTTRARCQDGATFAASDCLPCHARKKIALEDRACPVKMTCVSVHKRAKRPILNYVKLLLVNTGHIYCNMLKKSIQYLNYGKMSD